MHFRNMNSKVSSILTFSFIFILFAHLFEAVYFTQRGTSLVPYRHIRLSFPFVEKFYLEKTEALIHRAGSIETLNQVSLIQSYKPFFISRIYWVLLSRFYIMPQNLFEAGAQNLCEIITAKSENSPVIQIDFIVQRSLKNEIKKIYACKS